MAEGTNSNFSPIDPAERIDSLDILRGFAIFGVLWVNLTTLSWGNHPGPVNFAAAALMRIFGAGKFLTLFMFLFGAGFAIQLDRAGRKAVSFSSLYLRRMSVLGALGVAHHLFGSIGGDILLPYAFAGAHLLLIERVPHQVLLVLVAPVWFFAAIASGTEMQQFVSTLIATPRQDTPWQLAAYQQAGFLDAAAIRASNIWQEYGPLYNASFVGRLAVFVLGLCAVRTGIFDDPSKHLRLLKIFAASGLCIGLTLSLIGSIRSDWVLRYLGAVPLGLAYGAVLMLLLQSEAWRRRLGSLAPIGRMALTNYLLHSEIFSTLCATYGVGARWLSPVESLVATLLLYPAQAAFSAWWLRRHRFGPFEWVWRALAYGRV